MIKKYFLSAALFATCILTFTSCGNGKTKNDVSDKTSAIASQEAQKESVKPLTADEFKTLVADYQNDKDKYIGTKPCVIDFYADWCGPCKQMSPVIEALAKEYAGKVLFYKVNIDNAAELADAYGIESIPTFFFCSTNGKIDTQLGSQPKENLDEIIRSLK
jgi:thioredoxin